MSTFSLFSQPADIEPATSSNLSADTSDLVSHSPILSLFELNNMVRDTLECYMPDSYWVQAEISEAREVRGHCYMELIEKDEGSATPIARASAKCWSSKWQRIKAAFIRATGEMPHPGMKVLLSVSANFHEAYGFSWIVDDIDPSYTLGDMARKRLAIINELKAQGVFDMQRQLSLPMFAMRIAVISSANAAGYGDFCNQLADNEYGFKFRTQLFPAIMQGEQVEASVIEALNKINDEADSFDVVVIIRGGGATADLSGFDTLRLAENVANFPLPIITGIGHERDESVLDLVAHHNVKTPTAAAAFLIDHLALVANYLDQASQRISNIITYRLQTERMRTQRLAERIPLLFSTVKANREAYIATLYSRLENSLRNYFTNQAHRLDMLEQRTKPLDPMLMLQRGYTITTHNGHIIRDIKNIKPGDEIVTTTASGSIKSTVKE